MSIKRAHIQPRCSPDSGHLRSSKILHIIWAIGRVFHMSKRPPSQPPNWPKEVIRGHGVKFCTAACGSPRRAAMKLTSPKYLHGLEITFPIQIWPLNLKPIVTNSNQVRPLMVTTWPKVSWQVSCRNQCTEAYSIRYDCLVLNATPYCSRWRSQSSGDGGKLAMEGPPGRVGPLPTNGN